MALIRALNNAISGLKNFQNKIDVIGNNIANVNTTAFKASRTMFQSQFSQTLSLGSSASGNLGGVNPQQVGLGMMIGAISQDFGQGSLETTGIASDLAIEGDGFFILNDSEGTPLYTRDGSFRRSISHELVSPATGFKVQGWNADASFNISTGGALTTISLQVGSQAIAAATEGEEAITDPRFSIIHASFADMRAELAARGIERAGERRRGEGLGDEGEVRRLAKEVGPFVDGRHGVVPGCVLGELQKRELELRDPPRAAVLLLHAPAAQHGHAGALWCIGVESLSGQQTRCRRSRATRAP